MEQLQSSIDRRKGRARDSPNLGQDGVEGLPWAQVPKASQEGFELGHSQCGHLEIR